MDKELEQIFSVSVPTIFTNTPKLVLPDSHTNSDDPPRPPTTSSSLKEKKSPSTVKVPESPERLARTIFVGNVNIKAAKDKILQKGLRGLFSKYGQVESIRFRSLISSKAFSKRVAFITGNTSEDRDTCNVYVVMNNSEDALKAAESLNGLVFEGKHLRVDLADTSVKKLATKKSVFVGNLPLNVKEESLWELFTSCGEICYVRIIRDRDTGKGKGFGYVAFKERAAVDLALQLNGGDCQGRAIRVSKCSKPGYQQVKKERKQKFDLKMNMNKAQSQQDLSETDRSLRKPIMNETQEPKHPAEIRKERKLGKQKAQSFKSRDFKNNPSKRKQTRASTSFPKLTAKRSWNN